MRKLNKSLLVMAVSSLIVAPSVQATNGYFSDGYGAKSRGMGGSGVAIAQETGSILQNPAAAVGIGQRYDAAMGYFSPHPRSVVIAGNGALDQTNVSGRNDFFIPFYGQSFEINDSSSWAVTMSALGGMNTDYVNNPFQNFSPTPTVSLGNMGIDLKQAQLAGTYAIELSKGLSLGATLGFVIQEFQARGLGIFGGFGLSADPTKMSDNGKSRSTGFGMNLGVMYDMGNGISLGAQYAPEVDMSEFDEYAGLFAEKGDFDIPSHYSVGIAWQASSSVLVAFDYRRINYTDVAAISNDAQRLTATTGSCMFSATNAGAAPNTDPRCLGGAEGAGFGWSDQDVFKIGVAVDQGNGVTYRIGWNHGASPVDVEDAVLNIIAPAVTEDHLTLGLTKALSSESEVTIDFIRSFENTVMGDMPIAFDGDGNPANGAGTSTLSMAQKFLEINYARRF